jgi:hypothetical protein
MYVDDEKRILHNVKSIKSLTASQTVLQQHVLFWDRDGDGLIYPYDTYIGFRELGFNILFSILAMLIINVNFSYPTRLAVSYIPDPRFRVYVHSIHKAKVRCSKAHRKRGRELTWKSMAPTRVYMTQVYVLHPDP